MTYGEAVNSDEMARSRYLPEGLVEGCVRRDIAQDEVITYDDVELPSGRLADRLRDEQLERFKGETWLSELSGMGDDVDGACMKSVIFCGGRCSDGRGDQRIPKPMIRIGNRPILWHIMRSYASWGTPSSFSASATRAMWIKEYFWPNNESLF